MYTAVKEAPSNPASYRRPPPKTAVTAPVNATRVNTIAPIHVFNADDGWCCVCATGSLSVAECREDVTGTSSEQFDPEQRPATSAYAARSRNGQQPTRPTGRRTVVARTRRTTNKRHSYVCTGGRAQKWRAAPRSRSTSDEEAERTV